MLEGVVLDWLNRRLHGEIEGKGDKVTSMLQLLKRKTPYMLVI
jgi:hypothetical protein